MAGSVHLSGGYRVGSISVELPGLTALAGRLRHASVTVAADAATTLVRSARAAPELLVVAPLAAPVVTAAGMAAAEASGAAAQSLLELAIGLGVAVASYGEVERANTAVAPNLRALVRAPRTSIRFETAVLHGSWHDATAALTTDPDLVGVAVQAAALGVQHHEPQTPAAAIVAASRSAGALYRDGTPVLTARSAPTGDELGPPRTVADLIRALALRSSHNLDGGEIDVRSLGRAGVGGWQEQAVVVDLPGTSDWSPWPGSRHPAVSDLSTDLRAMGNENTVYERGVVLALRSARVSPTTPVMLVGHSEGGLVAARLAADLRHSGEFDVTHVVTAGTPLGLADVPATVSVLSLENDGDLVPALDDRDNPARPSWLTARFDGGGDGPLGRHSLEAYLTGATDLDAATAPELEHWRQSATSFLTAADVRTQTLRIGRQ